MQTMDRVFRPHNRAYLSTPLLFLAAILATAIGAESQSQELPPVHIGNFGQANESYYRGGQPDTAGFAELKRLGIRTVIDLREGGGGRESTRVREAGMQYFNIPLSSYKPATAEQTEYFLKLVNDARNRPVYVHCARGRHRTGEMTAIYRINHDAWTAEQAYGEMKRYGYYSLGGHGSLKDYVYEYYRNYVETRLAQPATPGTPASIRE